MTIRYSLDTSALLDGRARYYPPDVFPKLWQNFEQLVRDGGIKASEMVRYELEKKDDETFGWVKELDLFVDTDEEIQQIVTDILRDHKRLVQEGGQRSLGDPWVIALAKQKNCVVVTGENGGSDDRPKIPSVCRALNIDCISILELIRRERWTF